MSALFTGNEQPPLNIFENIININWISKQKNANGNIFVQQWKTNLIIDLFYHLNSTEIKCLDCNCSSYDISAVPIIQLSLPETNEVRKLKRNFKLKYDQYNNQLKATTLTQCLDKHFGRELADKPIDCDKCGRNYRIPTNKNSKGSTRENRLASLPKILVFQLKRYTTLTIPKAGVAVNARPSAETHTYVASVNNLQVEYPITDLNIENYCNRESRLTNKTSMYNLVAISTRYGRSVADGHCNYYLILFF